MSEEEKTTTTEQTTTTVEKQRALEKVSKQLEEWQSYITLATVILCVLLLLFVAISLWNTGGIPILHGIHVGNLANLQKAEAFSVPNPVTGGEMYF